MLKKFSYKNIIWYDFLRPNEKNFLSLTKKFKINPYITKKFLEKTTRDRALILGNHFFLSISVPNFRDGEYKKQKIKFILSHDYIITSSCYKNEGLEFFKEIFESKNHFKEHENFDASIIFSFANMFKKIYKSMSQELDNIENQIECVEKNIFSNKEKRMVMRISKINKKLIDFNKYIRTHEDIWITFLKLSETFFDEKESKNILKTIDLSYKKVTSELTFLKETLRELRDTNNSLLESQLNETTKTFTLIAFLTLPISLFISLVSIPEQENYFFLNYYSDNYNFHIILIISFLLFLITLIISKFKKWW